MSRSKGLAPRAGPALALLVLGLTASCSSALRHPDASDAAWAREKWSTASVESLEEGRARYVEKCAGCHQLHAPNELAEVEWRRVLQEMQAEHDVELSAEQAEHIFQYLVTAGRARD